VGSAGASVGAGAQALKIKAVMIRVVKKILDRFIYFFSFFSWLTV
jgi:hypothetical protein